MPLTFIIWRFELFQKVDTTTFGVWGILCVIILVAFISVCGRYFSKANVYSYPIQLLNGTIKVIIPCALVFFVAYQLRDTIDLFIQVMGVITICEAVAVAINPLPKWLEEHKSEKVANVFEKLWERKEKK